MEHITTRDRFHFRVNCPEWYFWRCEFKWFCFAASRHQAIFGANLSNLVRGGWVVSKRRHSTTPTTPFRPSGGHHVSCRRAAFLRKAPHAAQKGQLQPRGNVFPSSVYFARFRSLGLEEGYLSGLGYLQISRPRVRSHDCIGIL